MRRCEKTTFFSVLSFTHTFHFALWAIVFALCLSVSRVCAMPRCRILITSHLHSDNYGRVYTKSSVLFGASHSSFFFVQVCVTLGWLYFQDLLYCLQCIRSRHESHQRIAPFDKEIATVFNRGDHNRRTARATLQQ